MNTTTTTCTLALTPEDLDAVYRLRYSCYRRAAAIAPRADSRFSDSFDAALNHFSFLVRDPRNQPAATVRISVVRPDLGWTDSPAGRVYGDHSVFRSVARRSFVEAGRLCFGQQARRGALIGLVAYMAALADFYEVEWLVACPRVEHANAYERLFGFRPLAGPRRYFGVDTLLLAIRTEELRTFVAPNRLMTRAWLEALERLLLALPPADPGHAGGMTMSASSGK